MDKQTNGNTDQQNDLRSTGDRESYWINKIDSLNKEHTDEITNLIAHFNATTASAAVEHERKLGAQKSIDALTNISIQEELHAERAEHDATKQELKDTHDELDTMRQDKEQTVNDLCARAEEAVDAKQEKIDALERDLSIFRGIDSAQALANHITHVQGFIDRLSEKLASRSFDGELDGRSQLQIKDLNDSLMLKRTDNYTSVFLSEQACIMGYTFSTNELGAIGGPVAKRVREEGMESMSKHTRFVNGMIVRVNSYSEASREIINDELRKAWNKKQARA
jgi:hypothetical protein